MRAVTAVLLLSLSLSLAAVLHVDESGVQYRLANKVFLQHEKDLLRLFRHVFQPNFNDDQVEIAKNFTIEDHILEYTSPKAVKELIHYSKIGFLPRGQIFSVFNEAHRVQARVLFNALYYAKTWETFYNTACWARENVNENLFVYAVHAAVLHRFDTQGMVLPPLYEINPYFFTNSKVIDKAFEYKMMYNESADDDYYVYANYSGWYVNNPEQSDLSYFTEDVDLNSYYYYYHLDYPFWLGGKEFGLNKDRRGELFYYVHQQLLARYYLERLSNGYGKIDLLDWELPIKTGYVPLMRYPNGVQFPTRPANAYSVKNIFVVEEIEDYERRIRDAIDLGYVITEDGAKISLYDKQGFDLLGQLIESNPDSPSSRYYGYLQVIAHQVLGYSSHVIQYKVHPSALEHFQTALRDPVFYQFYNRIVYYFLKYKKNLPAYTYSQLNYSGVSVDNVEVNKLVTYFDDYDWELTNALYVNKEEYENSTLQVWARQSRLNHKPFTYKVYVTSDKVQNAVVRVYLGPKFDEQGQELLLNENRVNFVELDQFVYYLQAGANVIERNSSNFNTTKDRTNYRTLYQQVEDALLNQGEFHLDMSEGHNRFPNRLVLPKGTPAGQAYQLYVYVSPYKPARTKLTYDQVVSAGVGSGARYLDDLPFGYPLDREITYENNFYVPNSFFKDVFIYHVPQQ